MDSFSDAIRGAQVNETLARLYLEINRYTLARQVIEQSVETLELTNGDAFLAEALTTAAIVGARQMRYGDARKSFEAAIKSRSGAVTMKAPDVHYSQCLRR